jgi:serine/threonine protein kinase
LFTGSPKITDFGVSAELGDTRALLDSFKGTVFYMSPERVENKDYDFAADVWSLGVVVLECALGKYPYDDTDGGPLGLMMQITKDDVPIPAEANLPEHLTNFVKRCMRKNPRERPSASRLRAGPHPYIAENEAVDAGTWVRSVVSPLEVLEVRLFLLFLFVIFADNVRANRLTACFVYL